MLAKEPAAVVTKAARLVAERRLTALAGDLAGAFERFMEEPETRDKGCRAKAALLRALRSLDHDDPALFLRAMRHRQPEPVWGGTVDTAVDVRGIGALAMIDSGDARAIDAVSELLADPETPVRIAAAKGLGALGDPAAVASLRLKTLVGDPEQEVVTECMSALLALDAEAGCEFLERYLADDDAPYPESAALALGESRAGPAFAVLRDWYEAGVLANERRAGLTAIALLRREEAFAYLMAQIEEGSDATARAVVDALSIYAPHETLRDRALAAARAGGHDALEALIEASI